MVAYLWLIPALPLLAAGIGALTPRRGRRLAGGAAIAAMAGSLVLSCLALNSALADPSAPNGECDAEYLRRRLEDQQPRGQQPDALEVKREAGRDLARSLA